MISNRTLLEKDAGKLISAIQKEWDNELGEPCADESMAVMDKAHDLLQACKSNDIIETLGSMSVVEFLGTKWVSEHPKVVPNIQAFEETLKAENV